MATFGAIASPFAPANTLFDAARQDLQLQQYQRNRLGLQAGEQDMADRAAVRALGPGLAQQSEAALGQLTAINPTMGAQVGASWGLRDQRRGEHFARDNAARLQLASSFLNVPDADAPAMWTAERARLQAAGLGLDLPEAYPGRPRMEALVRGGMPMLEQQRLRAMEQLDQQMGGGAAPAGGSDLPRGLRNNNPLNIEAGNFTQGQPGFQGSDGRFARFETIEQGMAAADTLLQSYAARGLNTPAAIIGRWAPASDGNNVSTYAASVARELGVRPDQPIDMRDPAVRRRLAEAMVKVENGRPLPTQAAAPGGAAPGGAAPAAPADATPVSMTTNTAAPGAGTIQGGFFDGLTQEQATTLRSMRASPGADPGGIARQAQTYREQNRQAARQAEADKRAEERAARQSAPADPNVFGANGLEAETENTLLRVGPKILAGSATEAERRLYDRAYERAIRGNVQQIPDPSDPTGQRMMLARIPGSVSDRFPHPDYQPGSDARPGQGGAGDPNTPRGIPGTTRPAAPPTEAEAKNSGYASRMIEAETMMRTQTDSGYRPGGLRDAAAGAAGGAGNYLVSEQGQQFQNAAEAWVRAKLRRESGAVIGEEEMRREIATYFPRPGDSAKTIEQKADLRRIAMEELRTGAGRHAPPVPDGWAPAGAPPRTTGPGGAGTASPPAASGGWSIRPAPAR